MTPSESRRLLDDVDAFCRELRPVEDACYLANRLNEQTVPLARKYHLMGMLVPEAYGGRGADTVTYARAIARIGREGTGVRTFFSGQCSIGAYPIQAFGTEEQKRHYLPAAARGEKIFAFALTEPEAGSNPLEMTTTYERRGDHYVLNGSKYLVSNGFVADAVVSFAYPKDRPADRPARISAFIVDTKGPGFVKALMTNKMGMPTAISSKFDLVDHPVPVANLLGSEGDGFRVAMGTLVSGRISVAAGCVGVIEDCLAEAVAWAKQRRQHGKVIAKHQLVQEHIAAIEMHRVSAEALVMRAAEAKDASAAEPTNADRHREADLLTAKAKLFAAQAAWDAADRAVQVLGGRGFFTDYRPARHLQDTRVCRIYEGTEEVLKLKIAAAVLGKEYEAFK